MEDILLKRAKSMLRDAFYDLEQGDYSLALFHAEQAVQLAMKHVLFMKIGDFPKTHSLSRLFKEAGKVEEKALREYEENLELVYVLEDAYITSRYLPREYDEEIARRAVSFAEKMVREAEQWTK